MPGLMHADDVALLVDSHEYLQALVKIYGDKGDAVGFTLSAAKQGFIVFNDTTDQVLQHKVKRHIGLQNTIPRDMGK